jgi:hypothetical protein
MVNFLLIHKKMGAQAPPALHANHEHGTSLQLCASMENSLTISYGSHPRGADKEWAKALRKQLAARAVRRRDAGNSRTF